MAQLLSIDEIIQQWREQRPDLDVSPMRTLGQLARASHFCSLALQKVFSRHGLSASEFDILATLRRSGAPYALNPSRIVAALMINNSTLTSRLDRLEKSGYIQRVPIADDRRSLHIELTAKGLDLIDRVVAEHVENERRIVSPLSAEEQETLVTLLNKLERHLAAE